MVPSRRASRMSGVAVSRMGRAPDGGVVTADEVLRRGHRTRRKGGCDAAGGRGRVHLKPLRRGGGGGDGEAQEGTGTGGRWGSNLRPPPQSPHKAGSHRGEVALMGEQRPRPHQDLDMRAC